MQPLDRTDLRCAGPALCGKVLLAGVLGLMVWSLVGCSRPEPPSSGDSPTAESGISGQPADQGASTGSASSQPAVPGGPSAGGPSAAQPGAAAAGPATPAPGTTPSVPHKFDDARQLLEAMVAAYQMASSYSDQGTVRLFAQLEGKTIDETEHFSVALVRPNKLRMEAYQVVVVCDGERFRATIGDLPDQVLSRPAPAALTVEDTFDDQVLLTVVRGGMAAAPPQLILLLHPEPLKVLFGPTEEPKLAEPGTIGQRQYYRVRFSRPEGILTLWIDQETLALRRIVYPGEALRPALSQLGTVQSVSLVADFAGAQFNAPVRPQTFSLEVPPEAREVEFFVPPHPAQLLGKKVPPFKFFTLDKKPVTPADIAGRVTVLAFWASAWPPSVKGLPELQKVFAQFAGDSRVAFYAVSLDQPQTEPQEIQQVLSQAGVTMPVLRDLELCAGRRLKIAEMPCLMIIDAQGIVQHFQIGFSADLSRTLPEKLSQVLAGKDIYHEPLAEYEKQLQLLQHPPKEPPYAEIAAATQPERLRLVPLWRSTDVDSPGNILVLQPPGGAPRLLVVEGGRSLAEVGLDGKLLASHEIEMEQRELVATLRAAGGADGKVYVVGLASAQQRLHLFDQQFRKLFSFPEDAWEHPHDGIADVQLADLDGDGGLELYVGYWGVVGVQQVSLEGKRTGANRSIANVIRLAVTGPDSQGRRRLVCINERGSLSILDHQLRVQGEVNLANRLLHWIVAADLTGDGQPEFCALSSSRPGQTEAVGLNLEGKELWHYRLPDGLHRSPVEPVVAGRISAQGPGCWLLAGADGSIHIISAAGQPIDHFNYGRMLTGLATAQIDGRPVLIVASAQGLEALAVQ